MTKVSFEIYVVSGDELEEISEEDLASGFEHYRELLLRQTVLEGALVIEAQDQSPVRIEDELWAVVQGLCFACIPAVLEEKRDCWFYRYQSTDGHVVMIPLADLLRLVGEHIPAVTEAKKTLLPALYHCGVRFRALLERLGGKAGEVARYLQPSADKAHDTLQRHGML
jgi:hypothetical protein